MFSGMSLRPGRGDGTFGEREHTAIPSALLTQAPAGTGFELFAADQIGGGLSEDEGDVRLTAYRADASEGFEPTVLDRHFAPYTFPSSIGVGEVDADGRYRVYVRVDDTEAGNDGDLVYEIHGETATRGAPVAAVSGQPRFSPASAQGIWIADFDGDGLEDALQTHAFIKSHEATTELYSGLFLEQLHWLVEQGTVACDALDTMNFGGRYTFHAGRFEPERPASEAWSARALARLNADDAFDLLFTNDEGTFVALGVLGPACEPIQSDPSSTEWSDAPPCPELEFVAMEQVADTPWSSVEVADLDGDGLQDIVGLDGSLVHILLRRG